MKRVLNKWQTELSFHERLEYMDGRRTFIFGIYKLTRMATPGAYISREEYKGFIFKLTILIRRER